MLRIHNDVLIIQVFFFYFIFISPTAKATSSKNI